MLAMIGVTYVVTEMGGDKKDPVPDENDKNHERREKAKQR